MKALLIEPFDLIADFLSEPLVELGYEVDLIKTGDLDERLLLERSYDCAVINLDQNRPEWRDLGLELAHRIKNHGVPVVMIPDSTTARATIAAHGWQQIAKPFSVEAFSEAICKAAGGLRK